MYEFNVSSAKVDKVGNEAILKKYWGTENTIAVPKEISGHKITTIGRGAFSGKAASTNTQWHNAGEGIPACEIVLPETIDFIEEGAFANCKNLFRAVLPMHIESFSQYLFSNCRNLAAMPTLNTVKSIGGYAFSDCRKLTKLTLAEGLVNIGDYAFYNCRGITEIYLPESLEKIGTGAFKNCEALEYINLAGYKGIQNVVADMHHTFTVFMHYPDTEHNSTVSAKLLFPEEACEYIEDYPARQFHQVNYGTGHLYRQCISNLNIDYDRYDKLFTVARREEPFERVVAIANNRLCYDYCLKPDYREAYGVFFLNNLLPALKILFNQGDIKAVESLAQMGIFNNDNIEGVISLAASNKQPAIAGYLMDYKHRFLKRNKKTFEL